MKDLLRTACPLTLTLGLIAGATQVGWAADIVRLGLGGAYVAAATSDDAMRGPKLRQEAFSGGTEIQFKGRTVLDTGLEVGFHTEISQQDFVSSTVQGLVAPGRSGNEIESMFVYVKSGLGTFALGEPHAPGADAVAPYLSSTSPADDNRISLPIFRPLELRGAAAQDPGLRKVSYFTPRFGGVQFGVSFSPPSTNPAAITLNLPANIFEPASYGKALEFNANYKTQFNGFQVEFGGSYLSGRSYLQDKTGSLEEWGASGAFGYALPRGGDLSLAGSYRDSKCSSVICGSGTILRWLDSGGDAWNVGLRYSLGSWNVGGYFLTGHRAETFKSAISNQNTMVFLQTSIDF